MRRRSLRLRLLLTFGLGALILSSMFASLTYLGVQRLLINDQQQTDLRQSFVNAALVRSTLYTSPPQLANLLSSIQKATASNVLVQTTISGCRAATSPPLRTYRRPSSNK